jgi:ABC-type multidrug transport system fused ATPase/permease subunit
VEEASAATGLSAVSGAWDRGLDTEVGEGGSRLSVGERQLACLARALARDPRLLLLDEATASVDPATEGTVSRAMEVLMEGRTTLVVAHRLSTVLSADRILVLHRGRLREEGTHAGLLARGGLYRRLWDLQFRDPA